MADSDRMPEEVESGRQKADMRVAFIGHASLLVESSDASILSDPWWRGPCFGAQWWVYPRPRPDLAVCGKRRFVYISHGHHDHLHPGTLRTLPKGFEFLVSSQLDIASALEEIAPVRRIDPEEAVDLGGMTVRIWPTHGDDSLLTVEDGRRVLVNLNDALHSAPDDVIERFVSRLRSLHRRIDYLWCGFGTASHFPNCYQVPGKDRLATARYRQLHFNRRWARIVGSLRPKFAFPFAADVALLENELFWANAAIHDSERPTETFAKLFPGLASSVTAIDPAPGFVIEGEAIVHDVRRSRASLATIRSEMVEEIDRANDYGRVPRQILDELEPLLLDKLRRIESYAAGFPGDYRVGLEFRGLSEGFVLTKEGARVSLTRAEVQREEADLRLITRAHYLRAALSTPYGHEILFVGSGLLFVYRDRAQARRDLHRELMVLCRPLPEGGVPRRPARGITARAKAVAKRIFGREQVDLYSLTEWTLYTTAQ